MPKSAASLPYLSWLWGLLRPHFFSFSSCLSKDRRGVSGIVFLVFNNAPLPLEKKHWSSQFFLLTRYLLSVWSLKYCAFRGSFDFFFLFRCDCCWRMITLQLWEKKPLRKRFRGAEVIFVPFLLFSLNLLRQFKLRSYPSPQAEKRGKMDQTKTQKRALQKKESREKISEKRTNTRSLLNKELLDSPQRLEALFILLFVFFYVTSTVNLRCERWFLSS